MNCKLTDQLDINTKFPTNNCFAQTGREQTGQNFGSDIEIRVYKYFVMTYYTCIDHEKMADFHFSSNLGWNPPAGAYSTHAYVSAGLYYCLVINFHDK